MYESFFGLQARPFPAAPLVANYFPSQSMEAARQNLIRAVSRTEGPGVVIGPAGTGKSLLLRVLAEHFTSSLRVVELAGTRVTSRKSLLQNILFELNLPYRGMDEGELRLSLLDTLRRGDALPHGILLLIDEAHLLPLRLIDEARLITNVVHDGQPRVRLVLAGGPQLEDRLTNPHLDSFNQRIAARCYLQSFSRDETCEYIRAEISWAGGDADAIFSHDALQAVFRASDGVPRLINQVCDHALVMAQAATSRSIDATQIQEAWADLQQLPPPWPAMKSAGSGSNESVVEFGGLDDSPEASTAHGFEPIQEVPHASSSASYFEPSSQTELDFDDATTFDSIDEGAGPHDLALEVSTSAARRTDQSTRQRRAPEINPFNDSFDEELVVIDRTTAMTTDGFRGRPRVSCIEGREIVDALAQVQRSTALQSDEGPGQSDVACMVSDSLAVPAFEYSTLQDLPAIDSHDEFPASPAPPVPAAHEHVELTFEDEVDCVPLPWTRGTLGDDRDIIVIEDDAVAEAAPAKHNDAVEPGPRKTEYRELLAQLRQASN